MKKIVALLLVAMMIIGFSACSSNPVKTPEKTLETDKVKVDGFFVDSSYEDSDGKPLKMVYVFLSFKASESNYKVDAKYSDLKIGDNTYSSDFYKDTCMFMPNYYYSSYIEEIFVGTEIKVALTFKVPEGDLQSGKAVTVSDADMPLSGLCFTTDDLVSCGSVQEIGEKVDPIGCAEVLAKRELADDETTTKVRKAVNGYYWEFYVSLGTSVQKHEIEFYSPNKFELRTSFSTSSGTYEVHNGYIFLHYKTTDEIVEIPYEFENGEIQLDCGTAFSIYE